MTAPALLSDPGRTTPPDHFGAFSRSLLLRSPFGSWFRFASAIPVSQGFGWRPGICFWREGLEAAFEPERRGVKGGFY